PQNSPLRSASEAALRRQARVSPSAEGDSGALPLKTPPKGAKLPLETQCLVQQLLDKSQFIRCAIFFSKPLPFCKIICYNKSV
ncbi:MAG: hypothetical protein IKK42_07565, partial [Oscillospiraceae bacterium]|nr:hypothetical protein [Oscillospiraceae bacterium]